MAGILKDTPSTSGLVNSGEPNKRNISPTSCDNISGNYYAREPSSKRLRLLLESSRERAMVFQSDKAIEKLTCKNVYISEMMSWGVPESILIKYRSITLFPWQIECLNKAENDYRNLVYSSPTSAGKTLISEILALKTLFKHKKKVLFVVPYISKVRERTKYFQNILNDIINPLRIRIEGYIGLCNTLDGVDFAICTIEKANGIVNKLLQNDALSRIGLVVINELQVIADPKIGYLLELLLTKLKYMSATDENSTIQIVAMSAPLVNLDCLAQWLDSKLFTTNFRAVQLSELAHIDGKIFDNQFELVRELSQLTELKKDTDNIVQLCLETIRDSGSVLILCASKNGCEMLSGQIAGVFSKLIIIAESNWGKVLRLNYKPHAIGDLLHSLRSCPIGLDAALRISIGSGVAYHHAGLTLEEKEIIEEAFRNGIIKVLVATTTLSCGVNLQARRVIIRNIRTDGKPLNPLTYKQMVGRAGRMGKDSVGESILICKNRDKHIAQHLLSNNLTYIKSSIDGNEKLKRGILDVIVSGVASTPESILLFVKCTFLSTQVEHTHLVNNILQRDILYLKENNFIAIKKEDDGSYQYEPTALGKACFHSSIEPEESFILLSELEKARQGLVLESELHLLYLIIPPEDSSVKNMDWLYYLSLWERLPPVSKKVGQYVNVQDYSIIHAFRGATPKHPSERYNRLTKPKKFYMALMLQDLLNKMPLADVCHKYGFYRGVVQKFLQSAQTYTAMVKTFCEHMGWTALAKIFSNLERLFQNADPARLDLMRLSVIGAPVAEILRNNGITSLRILANNGVAVIENILCNAQIDENGENTLRIVWVTAGENLSENDVAKIFVTQALEYLQLEMGVFETLWENDGGGTARFGGDLTLTDEQVTVSFVTPMNQVIPE